MALTPKSIARLLRVPGRHHDGHGLYLLVPKSRFSHVSKPPAASWGLRYQRNGREHLTGLGPLHIVGLKAARERAQAVRLMLLNGIDPIEKKRADREQRLVEAARAMTFADAVRGYYDQHQQKWRSRRNRMQFLTEMERYALPVIGSLPVAAIDVPLLLRVLEQPIEGEGSFWLVRSGTAARLRGRIEAILDWSKARGYRQGDNPAVWDVIGKVLPAPKASIHHPALAYAEIPRFMRELRDRPGTSFRALEFCILTAARTNEVLGARWDEIDLKAKCWTIPAGRMKAHKEHRVPLSDRAMAILRGLPREQGNEFVFIGNQERRGLSPMMLNHTLNRLRHGLTVHGFRATFRTWAAEQTDQPREVAEQALAHAVGSQVERTYARTSLFDRRRQLMNEWAKFCS